MSAVFGCSPTTCSQALRFSEVRAFVAYRMALRLESLLLDSWAAVRFFAGVYREVVRGLLEPADRVSGYVHLVVCPKLCPVETTEVMEKLLTDYVLPGNSKRVQFIGTAFMVWSSRCDSMVRLPNIVIDTPGHLICA